jgi:hypothetical protein
MIGISVAIRITQFLVQKYDAIMSNHDLAYAAPIQQESLPLLNENEPNTEFLTTRASLALLPILFVVAAVGHTLIGVSEHVGLFYVGLTIGSTSVVCHILLNSLISLETSKGFPFSYVPN